MYHDYFLYKKSIYETTVLLLKLLHESDEFLPFYDVTTLWQLNESNLLHYFSF